MGQRTWAAGSLREKWYAERPVMGWFIRSPRAPADRSPRSTTIGSLIPLTVCTIVAADAGLRIARLWQATASPRRGLSRGLT
jgi:hypothetical protein